MRKTDPELLKNILVPRKERLKKVGQARSAAEEKVEEVKEVEVEIGKRCKTCQEVKQTSEFYKVGKYYMSSCKVCQNKARQELRKKKKVEGASIKRGADCSVTQIKEQEELKKPELVRQENEEVVEEQESSGAQTRERSSARESESEESEESSGAQTEEEEEDLSVYTLQENETHEAYYKRLKNELGSDAPKKKKNESFEDYYNKVQELIIAYSEGSQ